jgi:DivIVA domain-containing protein
MPFAPHEIEKKRFVVALRGYQTDEVEAFLRAVAADYRAALEATSDDSAKSEAIVAEVERVVSATLQQAKDTDANKELIAELERLVQSTREQAEREAKELRERAQSQIAELRKATMAHLQDERAAAEAEIAELREAAEREASEIRTAAFREAEGVYAEITRQAEELRRLESALWNRINVMEHTVLECRQAMSHVSNLHPMQPNGSSGKPLSTSTLPTVEELLYRVEAASLGTETNVEVSTADR